LIGLSTEDRIEDAAGVTCGTECRRDQLAPLRDAQARAVAACASIAQRRKGRTARSALSLLNAARV
jgi:hypothetical protein